MSLPVWFSCRSASLLGNPDPFCHIWEYRVYQKPPWRVVFLCHLCTSTTCSYTPNWIWIMQRRCFLCVYLSFADYTITGNLLFAVIGFCNEIIIITHRLILRRSSLTDVSHNDAFSSARTKSFCMHCVVSNRESNSWIMVVVISCPIFGNSLSHFHYGLV